MKELIQSRNLESREYGSLKIEETVEKKLKRAMKENCKNQNIINAELILANLKS